MELALGLLVMGLLLNVFHKCDAVLEVVPRDTEVMVNDSTYMNCSTSLEAQKVHWRHGNNYVYAGTRMLEPYNVRFSVEINSSTGTNNLVIRSVQLSDAGQYECLEDEGFGEQRSAQLVVLDGVPVCKSNMHSSGVIGPNTCGIEPDEIKLSCSITYHGNIFPILQWKASADNQSIIEEGLFNLTSNKNEVTYTLTMNITLDLNNSSLICQTTRTSSRNYNCSSDAIKILYIFSSSVTINMTLNDELNCFVNTGQSCSYKWKRFNGYDWIDLSNDQILKPKEVGRHRCEATCSIGNKTCTLEPVYAEVYSISDTNGQNLLALLVLFVLPVGLIGLFVAIFLRKKKRRNAELRQKEERQRIERRAENIEMEMKRKVAKLEEQLQRVNESGREEREQEHQRLIEAFPEKHRWDPFLFQIIKTEVKTVITGLTILDEELFVVSERCSEVEVYNSVKFSFSRRWNLEELFNPTDIGSCNRKKCLYIFDFKYEGKSKEILRVDPNGKLIRKWSTRDDYGLGLSVTDESNVILTVSTNNENKLNEYSPDGKLVREINLSGACIIFPYHAIKLANGHFLVTHGNGINSMPRVCLVDADGNLKKSFNGKCGSTIEHLRMPTYLAVDGNGFMMVVDDKNDRVLLLDLELEFKSELLSGRNFRFRYSMRRILLDQTTSQLLVTDGHEILIFSLSK